jgi:hypothetical protein
VRAAYIVPEESDLDTWAPSLFFWKTLESALPGSIMMADDGSPVPDGFTPIYDSVCLPVETGACVIFHQALEEYAGVVPETNYEGGILRQREWTRTGCVKVATCKSIRDILLTRHGVKCDTVILTPSLHPRAARDLSGPVAGWFGTHARGDGLLVYLEREGLSMRDVGPESKENGGFDGCSAYLGLSICGGFDPVGMDAMAAGLPVATTSTGQFHRDMGFDCSLQAGQRGSRCRFGYAFPPKDRVNTKLILEGVRRARSETIPDGLVQAMLPVDKWKAQWLKALETAAERNTSKKP